MRPRSPYCAFHRDEHLLLQFIIKESLLTLAHVKHLEKILESQKRGEVTSELLEKIKVPLCELSGGSLETLHFLIWPNGEGRLARLKGYCTWLLKQAVVDDTPLFRMDELANESWVLCMKSLDILGSLSIKRKSTLSLKKMILSLKRFSKVLPEAILLFMQDENVCFFLMRHKNELDAIYQKGFTDGLFDAYFSEGREQGKRLMIDRYVARGFERLIPEIETFFCKK